MNNVQKGLKERYSHIHPLLFHRSMEKARSDVELFDILEAIGEYPVQWDEDRRAWVNTDLLQAPKKAMEVK